MELEHRRLLAEMIAPDTGEPVRSEIDVRVDPLTGYTSRILPKPRADARKRLRPGGICSGEPAQLAVLPGSDRPADT
jgi:hypothetical protein